MLQILRPAALILVACLSLITISPSYAYLCTSKDIKPPVKPEKPLNRMDGLIYTYTKEYKDEVNQTFKDARTICKPFIGKPGMAIVCDLDETLLDNRPEVKTQPHYTPAEFNAWIAQGQCPVLKPTADFLAWARSQGFAIFLITGRGEDKKFATIVNLVRQKVAYDGLFMRPDSDNTPAEEFKTLFRKHIYSLGFNIVVNVGDQDSDLYGGYADYCAKLPNKMYFVP